MIMPLATGLLLLVASVAPRLCVAQAATVKATDFGAVAIGVNAKVAAITFSFSAPATVSSIQVGTQGVAGLDFTQAPGGTCAPGVYAAGARCTVNVNFVPATAGLRSGAAVLFGADGMPLAIRRVSGTGAGPVAVFNPGSVQGGIGALTHALAMAVDASGDRFVADTGNGRIVRITAAGVQSTVASGLNEPVAIAVDAAGDLVVADGALGAVLLFTRGVSGIAATPVVMAENLNGIAGLAIEPNGNVVVSLSASRQVVEIATQAQPVVLASFASEFTPGAIAVDSQGDLFVSATDAGSVAEIVPGGVPVMVLSGLKGPAGVAVDAAGDIYVAERYGHDVVEFSGVGASDTGQRTVLVKYIAANAVALEPDGSVAVVTDASGLVEIRRSNVAADFGPLANRMRLDSAVQNIGNASLVLSSVQVSTLTAGLSGVFVQAATGAQDCAEGETLTAGKNCSLAVQAAPPAQATATVARVSGQAVVVSNTLNALGTLSTLHTDAIGTDMLVFTPATASINAGTSPGVITASAKSSGVVDFANRATLPGTSALSVDALGTTAAVSTIARGNGVTLRVVMTTGGGGALYPGTITFVDLNLPSADQTVGSAQLLVDGTAALSLTPALGAHTYRAIFNGTKTQPGSVTASQPLSVTGELDSAVTLEPSGTPADYTLTATVLGYGFTTAPTGTVSFQDTTNSNAVVGTASLSGATFATTEVPQSSVTTGAAPAAIATGDLNGDGIADAVIANKNDGTLTVMLGNGDGTFVKGTTVNVGGTPTSVVAADFNNDGKLDLAVVDSSNGEVKVFTGNGDGTFTAGQVIAVGTGPAAIAAGDLNNDGNIDLAVSLGGASGVAILLGNGDGTFTVGTTVTGVGSEPRQVVIADFNHDGNADLAVAAYGSNAVSVELGAGDGTFSVAAHSPFAVGSHPVALAAADLDADGNVDLAVANYGDNTVDVLLGNGQGSFTLSGSPIAVGAGPNLIVATDFNNDGTVDLLTANSTDNTMSVLKNNGGATFAAATSIAAGTGVWGLAAVDLNGDGRPDLIATNSGANTASVFLTAQAASVSVANITFVATGSHLAVGVYSGDSNYATSTSNAVSLTSDTVTTTTTLTASPASPSMYGQTVTLTATITPILSYGVNIAGTVKFYDTGGAQIGGPVAAAGGVASVTLPLQALGGHSYTAIYSGSTGFAASTSDALPYTVGQSSVAVTIPAYSGAYGESGTETATVTPAYSITGQVAPSGTLSYQFAGFSTQMVTLSGGVASIAIPAGVAAGTGALTVSYSGDANYAATTGAMNYTISTVPLTVTVNSTSRVYGAGNPAFTGTITGTANGDTFTATYSTTATAVSAVGTYPITATLSGAKIANYVVTVVPGTLTVTPAALTITAANATRSYGVANPAFSGSIAGTVNSDVLTLSFTTTATTASNVGTYPIVPVVSGAAIGNYTVTVVDGALTITPATGVVITASNVTRLYGAANPAFSGTITGAPANSGLTVTGTTTATQFSAVGTYAIVPVLSGSNAGNYAATAVNGTLTITQTPTTTLLVSSSTSQVYGQSVTFTATVTPSTAGVPTGTVTFRDGTVLLGTVSLVNGAISLPTAGLVVGTHTITASYSGDTNFGSSASNSIAQLVTKATLYVTANSTSRTYGAADPAFTSTITGGLPGDVFTVTYATNETVTSAVGAYILTPTVTGSALSNYNVVYTSGTLTITPALLTITAANVTRQYMVANPTFNGSVSGAQNGDTFALTFSTTATLTSDVGVYSIVPAVSGTNLANYTVAVVAGTLTITPATGVVVTAGNATRLYGTANPIFTGTVSGTFANLGLTVTGTTTATLTSDAGTYAIVPGLNGLNPADYTPTLVNGVLTVAPAGSTIVLVSANTTAVLGANVNLTATVTSATTGTPAGQVYFYAGTTFLGASPLSGGVAALTTNAIPLGSNILTARYNGNVDFTSSTSNSVTETVQSNTLIVTVGNATRVYGAANPAFTSTITGALAGDTFSVSYSTTATSSSAPGNYAINATVTGANIAAYTVTVVPGVLTITQTGAATLLLQASSTTTAYGSPVVLTAALSGQNGVVPTGNVMFYDGSSLLGTVASSNGVATLTVSTLAAGAHTLTAQSAGDANYGAAVSNAVTETITGTGGGSADYTVTASPASLSIKQGGTGSTTLTLTPLNGYTGQLVLGCTTLPQYAACAFNPLTVTLNGVSPVTVTLTISTGTKVSALHEPQMPGGISGIRYAGFAFLPAMLLAGMVCFRRRWTTGMRLAVVLLGAVTMLTLSGCASITFANSGSSAGVTPAGTTTTTVTVSPVNVTTGVYRTVPITLTVTQ